MDDIIAFQCKCGAVTVVKNQRAYSMPKSMFSRLFAGLGTTEPVYTRCLYCHSNKGVDLCGCGSGNKYGECQDNQPGCRFATQSISDLKNIALARNTGLFLASVFS